MKSFLEFLPQWLNEYSPGGKSRKLDFDGKHSPVSKKKCAGKVIINSHEIHLTAIHFSTLRRHEAALTKFQISLKSLKLSVATPVIQQS